MDLESDLTTGALNETGTLTDQQYLQNPDEQSEKFATSKVTRLKSPKRTLAWDCFKAGCQTSEYSLDILEEN